jgi:hypothetical protein
VCLAKKAEASLDNFAFASTFRVYCKLSWVVKTSAHEVHWPVAMSFCFTRTVADEKKFSSRPNPLHGHFADATPMERDQACANQEIR